MTTDYQGCISIDLSSVKCPASANDRPQTKRHGPMRVGRCCPSLPVSLGSQGRVKRPRTGLRETSDWSRVITWSGYWPLIGLRETGLVRYDTLQLIIAANVDTSAQNGPNIMNRGKLKQMTHVKSETFFTNPFIIFLKYLLGTHALHCCGICLAA